MTFNPDRVLAVLFGTSRFDAVHKKQKNGNFKPWFSDLPEAKQDCKDLRDCLRHYNIRDDDFYNLDENPSLD